MTTQILGALFGLEPVKDPRHFRQLLRAGQSDFAIVHDGDSLLQMTITRWSSGRYAFANDRGDITKRLPFSALLAETDIGDALKRGAFFADVL